MKRFGLKIFLVLSCVAVVRGQQESTEKKELVESASVSKKVNAVKDLATPAVKEADVSKSVVTPCVATPKPVKKEPAKPALSLVNQIKIVIYSSHTDPIIITSLDLSRKSLDGRERTEQEVILDRIKCYGEGLGVYHMPYPEERVEKHLTSLREVHGISDVQIQELFAKEGYSLEEGKKELAISYVVGDLMQHLIIGKLIVTEQEIEEYYKKNPVIEPAAFRIEKGTLLKDEWTQKEIDALMYDGQYVERVQWGVTYWLELDEIADDRKFIVDMKPGEIRALESEEGYEAIRLVKRKKEHAKTLDERRREIADQLRFPKYQKMLDEYHAKLLSSYDIVYVK